MTAWIVALLALLYVSGLFFIANWAERHSAVQAIQKHSKWIYSLTLAVYCTSWTYYGAVGSAVSSGWDYIPIYLGPILLLLFGQPVLRKLLHVVKKHNVTSITDFISARYGKRHEIAAMTALLCLVVVVPYIALQLKAVASSYQVLLDRELGDGWLFWQDSALLSAVAMTVFAILFGTRKVHLTEQNRGVMTAIAFESVIKLLALVTLAAAVLFFVLKEPGQLIQQFSLHASSLHDTHGTNWLAFATKTMLAMMAIFLLPRQFHVTFVENVSSQHLRHAGRWFSGYLLLVTAVVLPIALAGLQLFPHQLQHADSFVLLLPASQGWESISAFVFIGGFSAATSMIIIATLALSTMISNDVVMPAILRRQQLKQVHGDYSQLILRIRRLMIVLVMTLSWAYYRWFARNYELAETGLLSFALIIQLAPAVLGGIYWKKGHAYGVYAGVIVGFVLWFFCLMLPQLISVGLVADQILQQGLFGFAIFRPTALFGLQLDPLSHGVLWSLGLNTLAYILVSRLHKADLNDRLQAVAFVKPNLQLPEDDKVFRKTTATTGDFLTLIERFVGQTRVREVLAEFEHRNGFRPFGDDYPHPTLLRHIERELAGVIGSPSASAMIKAVVEGRHLEFEDVVTLFDDTRQAIQFSRKILFSTLENLSQGVSVVDRDLQLVAWNKKYLQMFEYPDGLIRVGRPIADIVRFNAERGLCGPGAPDEHVNKRLTHMRNGSEHVFQRLHPDGTVIEIRGNPIPGGGFVTTFTDITEYVKAVQELAKAKEHLEQRVTERTAQISQINTDLLAEIELRKTTEVQLLQAKAEAEAANASKTRFLALTSHDILQPLNAARLFAAALQPQVPAQGLPMLQQLENSLKSTEDLMGTLLDIARLDEGKLDIHSAPVDLFNLLRPLCDEMALLAAQKGLQFRPHLPTLWVQSHSTYLRRIIQNLLSNAIKYTAKGRVVFGGRRRGDMLWLEIWDTGPGLQEADLERIFQDFYRVQQTARGESGAGLGLGVVQRMARALQHPLDVKSAVGHGSCFRIGVPIVPAGLPLDNPSEGKANVNHELSMACRILVLDDDRTNVQALATLLNQWQLGDVDIETDIEQALQTGAKMDVLIADYQLGQRLTGLEVFSQLKRQQPKLQGILVSAAPDPTLPGQAKNAGMVFLPKPIKPAALRAAFKSLKLRH